MASLFSTLNKKLKNTLRFLEFADVTLFLTGIMLALAIRFALRGYMTLDFVTYTQHWYSTLKSDGLAAFEQPFSNYPPLYLYLLLITNWLFPHAPEVVAIKIPSVVFDFVCAGYIYRIVRLRYPEGPFPLFAFLITLFAPTVVINGSMWGQADSVYAAALLACLYYLLTGRASIAMLSFGIAFALKVQAMFYLPLLIAVFLQRQIRVIDLLWIPAVYIVSLIPAAVAGASVVDLLLVYVTHSSLYPELTLHAPTAYAFLPPVESSGVFEAGGLIWGLAIAIMLGLTSARAGAPLKGSRLLHLALASVMIVPFSLPYMHERYFFPADVLSIAFAFYFPQYMYVAVGLGLISFLSYQPFLLGADSVSIQILAAGMLALIYVVVRRLFADLFSHSTHVTDEFEASSEDM